MAALKGSGTRTVGSAPRAPCTKPSRTWRTIGGCWIIPAPGGGGSPSGAGNTEATCKTLFTARMKRSGARWKEATAADVINLRALALSDRWEPALQLTLAPLRKAVRQAA